MKQVLIINGGSSFNSYDRYLDNLKSSNVDYDRLFRQSDWRDWLSDNLPNHDVLLPRFPNSQNAVYAEWEIYFEKILPYLDIANLTLVGYSLGGMFLSIYLNEHNLPHKLERLCLIAPGYDDETNEDLGSFKVKSAQNLPKSCDDIHLFHSQDDFVVPYSELAKFRYDLPSATIHTFANRNHFFQTEFPELLEIIDSPNQK